MKGCSIILRFFVLSTISLAMCSSFILGLPTAHGTPVVTATIPVGSSPGGVGVNPVTNRVYVSNYNDDTVSVIDGATGTVTGSPIAVGDSPCGIGVNHVTNRAYVAIGGGNIVSVIDGATGTVTATIAVGTGPYNVGVNPVTNRVYVSNFYDDTVSVIDGATGTVTATIPVGSDPVDVGVNPVTNRVYVSNSSDGTLSVIDGATGTVTATIVLSSGLKGVGVNTVTNRVYATNNSSNNVSVIDGATGTVTATIPVGSDPDYIGVNPVTNRVYATNNSSNNVSVIDGATGTVTATVTSGQNPDGVGVNPATAKVYVANFTGNSVSVIDDPIDFYFAEGYTGDGFQEYLCLGNAGDDPVTVDVTYLFKDGTSLDRSYDVPALSRSTISVNNEVGPDREVSIKCESPAPFIAERPMYFDYGGWTGGHDAVGATAPSQTWYFAEGYTGEGFDEYICVLNPGGGPADLVFNFQTRTGVEVRNGSVPAHTRATFKVNELLGEGIESSLALTSTVPVVAERPMYFDYLGPEGDKHWTGGHCVMGAPSLGRLYYFAEGTTRSVFQEYLTLQNPGASAITIDAVYQLGAGQGHNVTEQYTVGAGERATVRVWEEVGTEKDVSVKLTSASDFLAERPMYFNYREIWTGGHCVIGSGSQGTRWFFAEGYTGEGFHEWLTIQNTGTAEAKVRVTYYPESGSPIVKDHTVPPETRYNVFVNENAGEGLAICAGLVSDQPVIVERPMYFNYNGVWTGGHDVVGYQP